jgi:hypothetical protein
VDWIRLAQDRDRWRENGLSCTMRNFILFSHPQISLGKSSQVKANELGRACSTHGRGGKSVYGFGGKARRTETTRKTKA